MPLIIRNITFTLENYCLWYFSDFTQNITYSKHQWLCLDINTGMIEGPEKGAKLLKSKTHIGQYLFVLLIDEYYFNITHATDNPNE